MSKKILIVDPDTALQTKMKVLLERDGKFKALGAGSFAEADDMMHFYKPDIVIMELLLPDRNGVDLIVNIKQHDPSIKIIVYTDIKGVTIEKSVKKKGASLFVNKSENIEEDANAILEELEKAKKQAPGPGMEGFKGNLEGVDLRDLVQAFSLMGRDIILKIKDVKTFKNGEIAFRDGNVADAKTSNKKGEEAFKEIMSWENGIFEIAYPKSPDDIQVTITTPLDVLLLDVVRMEDELQVEESEKPRLTVNDILRHIKAEIPGFIGAMIFDYVEGAPLETETIMQGKTFHASAAVYGGILSAALEAMEIVTQGAEKREEFIQMILTDKNDHVIIMPLHVDTYAVFLLISIETKPQEALNVVKRYIPVLVELLKAKKL